MTSRRAAAIDSAKLQKAFRESVEGQNYVGVALALFKDAFTQGLRGEWQRSQATWAPLSDRYAAWKRRAGLRPGRWEMTGGTLAAITNNAPTRIGSKGKLRFGINFKSDMAFAMPRAFRKRVSVGRGKGRRGTSLGSAAFRELGNSEFQERVLQRLQRGGVSTRVRGWQERSGKLVREAGYGQRGWRAFFRKKRDTQSPARPFLRWSENLVVRAEAEVARKVESIMEAEFLSGIATA